MYELGSIKCYMPLMLALLICVYGLIQNIAWANDAEGGFVWKIQKSGQPDSYLIGTVHLGKKGAVLPESYVRILNKQTVLLVESNEDDWNGVNGIRLNQQMDGLIIAPVQLKNSVGSERIKRVNALLLRNGSDLQLDSNAYMAPWMVWMALATDYNMPGYSMDTGIDVLLMHAAKKRQRTIVALETIEPLHVFKRIPNARLLRAIDADLHNVQAMQQELASLAPDLPVSLAFLEFISQENISMQSSPTLNIFIISMPSDSTNLLLPPFKTDIISCTTSENNF